VREDWEREVVELDIVEKELDDNRVELEGVGEEVEVKSEVIMLEIVKLRSNVEEKSVVEDDEPESGSAENVGVRVVDEGNEVGGSIVMEKSENELETEMLLKSDEGISVTVGVSVVRSPELDVRVGVSDVTVLDDSDVSVVVGSPVNVSVDVGCELESKEGSKNGVDVGEPMGV